MTTIVLSDMSAVLYQVPAEGPCTMDIFVRDPGHWAELFLHHPPGTGVIVCYDGQNLPGVVTAFGEDEPVITVEVVV